MPTPIATLADALDYMSLIEGWFSRGEAELLYRTAQESLQETQVDAIVEIGSYCGRSTVVLAAAARNTRESAKVYAIDPHEGILSVPGGTASWPPSFETFTRNLEGSGVADTVIPIRRRSSDVKWTQPAALVFIDGLHDYKSVSQDFHSYVPWLARGGCMALHDYHNADYPGVTRMVDDLLAAGRMRLEHAIESLVIVRMA